MLAVLIGAGLVTTPSTGQAPTLVAGERYRSTVTLSESRAHRPFVVRWRPPGSSWISTQRGSVPGDGAVPLRRVLTQPGVHRVKVRLPRHKGLSAHVTKVRRVHVIERASTSPTPTSPTPTPTPTSTPTPGTDSSNPHEPFTAYAVGDIGYPGGAASATAGLIPDGATVLATGDLAYPSGTAAQLADHYLPAYGRLLGSTYPVPGNHDYGTVDAVPYFDLFGPRVGTPDTPWYSWQRGSWTFYHLNSNCSSVGGCDTRSPQYRWLADALASNPRQCIAALWHHPRWSASRHGPTTAVGDIYALLADSGADLLLTGHEHNYQRFDRLAADGSPSPHGIREFVTGGGGAPLYAVGSASPNPQVWDDTHFGVLELGFGTDGYTWRYTTTAGTFADSGADTCG